MTTPRPDRLAAPRWLNPAAWLLLPLLLLGTAEWLIRRTGIEKSGYARLEDIARSEKVDFLFLGTSRVWAGVEPEAFEDELRSRTGRVVNMARAGIGNSTNGQHLRGLRNVARAVPGAFQGTVVMIESRAGVPGAERGADLRNRLGAGALHDVLRPEDFPALLAADLPAEDKAEALVAWAAPPLDFVTFRPRFRRKLLAKCEELLRRTGWFPPEPERRDARIAEGGGIRTDEEGLEVVRAAVDENARRVRARQEPIDWEEWQLLDIVAFLQSEGATVFTVPFPLHPRDAVRWTTDVRQDDARRARQLLSARGVDVLRVSVDVADEEFPDHLHLNRDAADRFSRALAAAWAER